jgi:hypothetical protein
VQAILPNHRHTPPHPRYSAAKSLAHCPQTDNSAKSQAQAILPNHWHNPQHTRILPNHWHTVNKHTILPNHWFKILPNHWHAPPHPAGNSAKSLAHCPQTDNSAKFLAQAILCQITGRLLDMIWDRKFCQITGIILHIQAILPKHSWHTAHRQTILPNDTRTGDSAKSLAHFSIQAILPNHWHTVNRHTFLQNHCQCQITGILLHIQAILPNCWRWKFCQITAMQLLHISR